MIFSHRTIRVCGLFALLTAGLRAQGLGTIHGQVLDPSGAAVPQASVTATGPNSVVKVGTSDSNGAYSIVGLPVGKYTIRVIATGFNILEQANVDVPAGRPLTLDAHLIVQSEKQEVTVADTQQVELDPARNAGALVLKQEDLDMLSDDPDDLQADLLALAGPAAGPNGGQIFIDGFSNGQLPPKESIREIRINSNPFSAEYDTSGRGRIEIFTRPGTDKFHGTVNINYSDWLFNARNPFITSSSFAVPASDTKNLQANLNGPIIKNKLSFFLEFSRRQQREDSLINAYNPDTLQPEGFAITAPNTFNSVSPRIDYQLTPNITLQGRYTWRSQDFENQGVGGFNLPSTADTQRNTNQSINLTETQVVNSKIINETRFQYFRQDQTQTGLYPDLNISVSDAFTENSSFPLNFNNQNYYEFQNYTSITHGVHFIKFGARLRGSQLDNQATNNFNGQYNFDSLAAYAITQQGIAQGWPLAQILAAGGGASQYQFNYGQPKLAVSQVDAGLFYQDDWRVRPNITLSLGLRYEVQNNVPDHGDWAPRLGLAWGIGPSQGRLRAPKTVLRAGFGYFYDRFSLNNVLNTERFNGSNQVAYTITNPQFYPGTDMLPPLNAQLAQNPAYAVASATYHIDSALQAPRMQQAAIGLDRQLPKNITVSVNYINSRGTHTLRSVDINTPLPGTYSGPGTGTYPLLQGAAAGVYNLYESDGIYKQNQLIFNSNARINSRISLFGYYAYGHVNSNVLSTPSNPYNFNSDWGRASYDIRHKVNLNGSILTLLGLRISPNIIFNSAPPWNIVEGVDQFGDTSTASARPAFAPAGATGPACSGTGAQQMARSLQTFVCSTAFGNFVVNPSAGTPVIPVNYFNGFSQFNFNLRISRTWGFGESNAPASAQGNRGRGGAPGSFGGGLGGRGGGRGGPGGGGPPGGFFGGGDASGKRYTLTAGIFFHNLFNNVNPAQIETNLLSPRLGEPLALANIGGFGGNLAAQAFNRRIDLSLRFSF